MPIYEYECDACGERIEVMQKISERPLKQCPACTLNRLRKLVSASAFRLTGSGWYETDFKKGGKKNLSSGSDDAGADKDKEKKADKGEGKAEAKESAAESKPSTKEKDKDKGAGKAETARTRTAKKADSD